MSYVNFIKGKVAPLNIFITMSPCRYQGITMSHATIFLIFISHVTRPIQQKHPCRFQESRAMQYPSAWFADRSHTLFVNYPRLVLVLRAFTWARIKAGKLTRIGCVSMI